MRTPVARHSDGRTVRSPSRRGGRDGAGAVRGRRRADAGRVDAVVAAVAVGAGRRAERGDGAARRRRLRPVRLLRLGHRHADVRPPGRRRAALQQLPHDRAVLADARLPADRSQPPRQRDGADRRVRLRLPRLRRHDAQGQRVPVRGPRAQRLRHVRRRQVAPGAGAGDGDGGVQGALAARPRLRALLRVPRRRDRPVPPGPRARQPPDRPAAHAGGRLPPHRGPRRPGDRLHQGPPRDVRRATVLPVLRAGRVPCAAPGAQPVPGALPRSLRPGLGPVARGGVRPPAGVRPAPRRHAPQRAAGVGGAVGLARRRRAAAVRADDGGVRRVPRAHRRAGRSGRRLHRVARRARQHGRAGDERQRRQRRGRAEGIVQRELLLQHGAREPRGEPAADRRPRRARTPTTTTRGDGRGPATRRSSAGSGRPTRAGSPTR